MGGKSSRNGDIIYQPEYDPRLTVRRKNRSVHRLRQLEGQAHHCGIPLLSTNDELLWDGILVQRPTHLHTSSFVAHHSLPHSLTRCMVDVAVYDGKFAEIKRLVDAKVTY
jgi:hypothetical protein